MKFSIATAAGLIAVAAAAPAPQANTVADPNTVTIENLSVRKNNGLQAASFSITPAGASCSQTDATALVYPRMTACEGSAYNYYFQIQDGATSSEYKLTVTREVGMNSVVNGTVSVPVYCHAGGNGADDFVCSQVANATTTLAERFGTY
ncbi:Major allergen-like protein precursor [Neofusicoccum parvum]|uniref:AA1-like domain-containing protein n=3 Tax=Neofusicoccum TaxID=407951 RepID=A0ABR3SFB3_9PEZI|nr:putative major allergen-like protein, precursor [Neofusicoccum parvum UCRNP2]GME39540.1 Major allergen-like protein precursor [Neofusicoccum parvum]GME42952.1 Major allergen-like protein precursor [Neofusicoccum parvum]